MKHVPEYDTHLFSDASIIAPYEDYQAIRDLGPVVWLSALGVHAAGRYTDVRAALRDHETFISGDGVAINPAANQQLRGTTLASDPPLHDHLRDIVASRLTPRALLDQRATVNAQARKVVAAALEHREIDGVADIAYAMPMSVVPDFLGFPEDCRRQVIHWGQAGIDLLGLAGAREPAAVQATTELACYAAGLVDNRGLLPGSLGSSVLDATDRGEISATQCAALMMDYFGPSIETTASALGVALALFAQHPDQWSLLRNDPSLVLAAFNEVIRYESPLRGFTRVLARDAAIGDTELPAGARVWLLYASANRDERIWERADEFDITRPIHNHLALGHGKHACAGQGLARLEFTSVITALAESVTRIELAGEPVWELSSFARTYSELPLRLHVEQQSQPGTAMPSGYPG